MDYAIRSAWVWVSLSEHGWVNSGERHRAEALKHLGLRKALFLPCDYGWKANPKIEPGKVTGLDRFYGGFRGRFPVGILLAKTGSHVTLDSSTKGSGKHARERRRLP